MTITKDEIATALNGDLGREETAASLAKPIRETLEEISKAETYSDMHTSASSAIVADDWFIAKPTGFRVLDKITLNDGTSEGKPLIKMTWDQLLRNRGSSRSNNEPTRYVIRGNRIYFDPQSNGSYTATIWYWRLHPDQDTILFGDDFRTAIEEGTMMFYLSGLSLMADPKFAQKQALFGSALSRLGDEVEVRAAQTKYWD